MLHKLLLDHLRDPNSSWSCGRFGAIAEFHRDAGEPIEIKTGPTLGAVTDRGAIRLEVLSDLRAVAYETISSCIESWGQGMVLCLPRESSTMSGRTVVTELGPDVSAVRVQDREAVLFDLGLGGVNTETCVRSSDPETIALLRSTCGQPMLSQGALLQRLPALSPHRVFCSRLGRIEVYQPIPAPGGESPEGPHTHLLPRLLAHGRDHAATVPVPDGWVAGMSLYPAHPLLRSTGATTRFNAERYEAFQALMTQYGDPSLMAGKRAAFSQAREGGIEDSRDDSGTDAETDTRREALGFRIGQRQSKWLQAHRAD
ncbi:hypothetical protein BH11PSE3_BH11PSE3_27190 [soil metagenome]